MRERQLTHLTHCNGRPAGRASAVDDEKGEGHEGGEAGAAACTRDDWVEMALTSL